MPKLRCLPLLHQRAQRHFRIRRHHPQQAVQIAIVEHRPLPDQREIIFQNSFGARHRIGLTLDFDRVVRQLRADIQTALDQADIFVARAEKALDAAANLTLDFM